MPRQLEASGGGIVAQAGVQSGCCSFSIEVTNESLWNGSAKLTGVYLLLGRNANGRLEWKDAQGRTLKVLQADA